MKKQQFLHKAVCLAAAAVMSCAPLANLPVMTASAAAVPETTLPELLERTKKLDPNEPIPVLIAVKGDALLTNVGTDAVANGYLESADAAQRKADLAAVQQAVQDRIRAVYPDLNVRYSYDVLMNGFACDLPPKYFSIVEKMAGVVGIKRVETTLAPRMASASDLGGFPAYYDQTGCTGEGQVIAVIDSELDVTHPMFSALPEDTKVALTKDDVAGIIANAGLNVDVDVDQAYRSSKLPFVVDYYDKDNPYDGVANENEYHGTHVSGIAAGNEITDHNGNKIHGVAKDAQLVFMACGMDGGYISDDAVIAATEDAVKLHADVINMSFGGVGETFANSEAEKAFNFMEVARKAGVIICKSAGNYGDGSIVGLYHDATNPDRTMLDNFAANAGTLCVASADNIVSIQLHTLTIGEEVIGFCDVVTPQNMEQPVFMDDLLPEKDYEYVILDGSWMEHFAWDDEAYTYLPADDEASELLEQVNGKILVFDTTEMEKGIFNFDFVTAVAVNGNAAGAIAIFVDGEKMTEIGVDFPVPFGIVPYESGHIFFEAEDKTLHFTGETIQMDYPTEVSYYSSWGVHQNLELRPDIMGIGGYVESAGYGGNEYVMSGTSMSSPYMSGCVAIAEQYLKEHGMEYTGVDKFNFVTNIMMNSATPYEKDGMLVTPRQQGAGFVNLNNMIADKVIMTGAEGRAKFQLYDMLGDTFTIPVTLTNISDEDVVFSAADVKLTTDGVIADTLELKGQQPLASSADCSALLEIKAGESRTVDITVQLDANQTAALKESFINGFFIDGFVTLTGAENCCDISVPLVGYYGDWSAIPMFKDDALSKFAGFSNGYLKANISYGKLADLFGRLYSELVNNDYEGDLYDRLFAGMSEEDKAAYEAYCSCDEVFSPNGDGLFDAFWYAGFNERSGRIAGPVIKNDKGEVVKANDDKFAECLVQGYMDELDTTEAIAGLEDGTYTAALQAYINYQRSIDNPQTYETTFTVDNTAPEMTTEIVDDAKSKKRILRVTTTDANLDAVALVGRTANSFKNDTDDMWGLQFALEVNSYGQNPGFTDVDPNMSLFGKITSNFLGGDFDYNLMEGIDTFNVVAATPDKSGKFTTEFDITGMEYYEVTSFDRAFNMASEESELPNVEEINPGIYSGTTGFMAFHDGVFQSKDFRTGTLVTGTYELKDGKIAITTEQDGEKVTIEKQLVRFNNSTMRLINDDGTMESLSYMYDESLEALEFYPLNEIEELIGKYYEFAYAPLVDNLPLHHVKTTVHTNHTVDASIYVEYQGESTLLGTINVDMMDGTGMGLIMEQIKLDNIKNPENSIIKGAMWLAYQDLYNEEDHTVSYGNLQYIYFDKENKGRIEDMTTGEGKDFNFSVYMGRLTLKFADGTTRIGNITEDTGSDRIIIEWEDDYTYQHLRNVSADGFDKFRYFKYDELVDMAIKDYCYRNEGVNAEDLTAQATFTAEGTLYIDIFNANGKLVDHYDIEPSTATGKNQHGDVINLPKTGNNAMAPAMGIAGAVMLLLAGGAAMGKSGILRKKRDEE